MDKFKKIKYLAYIADDVYHIYKFSNYGKYKIKLISAGMAYDNKDSYTNKYRNLIKKYDLSLSNNGVHYTAETKLDFFERIYYSNNVMQTHIPEKSLLLIKKILKK